MFTQLLQGNLLLSICIGTCIAFCFAFFAFSRLTSLLPRDHGRAFAVEGAISKGKPTGAGLFFILTFVIISFLFIPFSIEYSLYLILILAAMLFGYLDDGAKKPWSEYLKGLLDLAVSLGVSLTFAMFSSREVLFPILGLEVELPFLLYVLLGTVLVWAAINVTNCTDGVDGLSSSLSITSILSILALMYMMKTSSPWSGAMLIMAACLTAYLWFNTNPSSILMGDAGSRAIGVFLAIAVMQSRVPLAYLSLCLLFILDGASGIIKISLKRFLKITILKNTLTPLHDHFRKTKNWPNQQVTVRATIFQAIISLIYLAIVYLVSIR